MAEPRKEADLTVARRQPGDLLFAVLFLLGATYLLSQLGEQTTWVTRGQFFAQPGFWPAISLGGMTVFGLIYLIGAVRGRGTREDRAVVEATIWLRSIEFAAWFMAYVLATPKIGYLPATLLFTVLLALRMGYRSRHMILSAAVMGVAIVVIFKALLQVKIPGGAVYEYLPGVLRNFMILYL